MRVIYSGRRTSRTTQLIEACARAEANGEVSYIVCGNHDQAYAIHQKAKEMGKWIGFPLTYDEFLSRRYAGQNIKNFFIDNADHLLQQLSYVSIRVVTMEKRENDDY